MNVKTILLASVAALALGACGGKDSGNNTSAPATKSSQKAASVTAKSPIDTAFKFSGGKELDFDGLISTLPEGERPTYATAAFDSKIGATVITDLQYTDGSNGETITIDRVELYGLDADAIDRVKAGEASIDASMETIFEKVRLFGVRPDGAGDDANVSIGAVEIDKLRLRSGSLNDSHEPQNPAIFFNNFDLAGLYFKDFNVEVTEEGGPQLSFRMPDARIVGLGGGKMTAMVMNDLAYEVENSEETIAALTGLLGAQGALIMNSPMRNFIAPGTQKVSMKSFVWRGFDLSGLLEYGLKDEEPPVTAKNLLRLGSAEATDFETYVNGKLAYKGEKSSFSSEESTWLIPSKVRAETTGDVYNLEAYVPEGEEELMALVKKNGLDNIKSSSSLAWDWDAKKGGAAFKANYDTSGFADLAMSFDLDGLAIEKIKAAMDAGDTEAVEKLAVFNNFNVTLDDEKLLDTLFDVAGLQMGQSGSDLRQSAPAMLRLSGAQFASLNPKFSGYVDALAAFVAEGGTLSINASPDAAVPLAAIAAASDSAPQTLPDVLDLEITHKK